jgi:hypothetical protein
MTCHPTILALLITVFVPLCWCHATLTRWWRSTLWVWWRGVPSLLSLESTTIRSEFLWGSTIAWRVWLWTLLLLSIKSQLMSERRSCDVCVIGEPITPLIKVLELWDQLRVWWPGGFQHGCCECFIMRTKVGEKAENLFLVWYGLSNGW